MALPPVDDQTPTTIVGIKCINCSSSITGGGFCVTTSVAQGLCLQNCIAINCSSSDGGGFYTAGSSLINCSIINCSASNYGGGLHFSRSRDIYNCVIWNCNSKDIYLDGTYYAWQSSIYNCAYSAITGLTPQTNSNPKVLTANPFTNLGQAPLNIIGTYSTTLPQTTDKDEINDFIAMFEESVANIHPATGQILIGNGVYNATYSPATDIEGITRSNPPTIGAYETIGV